MPTKLLSSLLFYLIFFVEMAIVHAPCSAETINLLELKSRLIPTGAENSLAKDKSLFTYRKLKKGPRYSTDSELTNIHSHYRGPGNQKLKNYTFTGRFKTSDQTAGIGFTFYSNYPRSDTYYRLRSFSGNAFHIEPHPDSQYTLAGTTDTGVVPVANTWHQFRIVVRTRAGSTSIKAKIWAKGDPVPSNWQVDCTDSGENRIKKGTAGVWAMGPGTKEWANLVIETR